MNYFLLQRDSSMRGSSQARYRSVRGRRVALELNTEAFLNICIPHTEVWNKLGWRGKNVSQIISQIVDNGIPTTSNISKKNNQLKNV